MPVLSRNKARSPLAACRRSLASLAHQAHRCRCKLERALPPLPSLPPPSAFSHALTLPPRPRARTAAAAALRAPSSSQSSLRHVRSRGGKPARARAAFGPWASLPPSRPLPLPSRPPLARPLATPNTLLTVRCRHSGLPLTRCRCLTANDYCGVQPRGISQHGAQGRVCRRPH